MRGLSHEILSQDDVVVTDLVDGVVVFFGPQMLWQEEFVMNLRQQSPNEKL